MTPRAAALAALLACRSDGAAPSAAPPPAPLVEPPAPTPIWPAAGAPLAVLRGEAPVGWSGARVMVDAGHGAPGNGGNTGCRCQSESDFTRRAQDAVLERLGAEPTLALRPGRPSAALRSYDDRLAEIAAWRPDAVLSLHSDTRAGDGWGKDPVTGCFVGRGAAGFSVLYADEGPAERVAARRRLARAVAARLVEAGFPAYTGLDYAGLYGAEEGAPGVFVDRHADRQRIKMLRRSASPLIIIETHQAVDPEEVARWEEAATFDAFAAALRLALFDALGPR